MDAEEKVMCKIIYFDEGSVSDYIQILSNGSMKRTVELLNSAEMKAGVSGKINLKGSVGGKFLKAILGWKMNGAVKANADLAATQNRMIKYIIKSTILTDFLDALKGRAKEKPEEADIGDILKFQDYRLETEEGMLSHRVIDFFHHNMDQLLLGEDISTEKYSKSLKYAKGYFEFIGISKEPAKRVIMRFNINCLKNGYTLCDLTKMDMVFYAIKVGKTGSDNLKRKETGSSDASGVNDPKEENTVDTFGIYDILLAGIETTAKRV